MCVKKGAKIKVPKINRLQISMGIGIYLLFMNITVEITTLLYKKYLQTVIH